MNRSVRHFDQLMAENRSAVSTGICVVTGIVAIGALYAIFGRKNSGSEKDPFASDSREASKAFEFDKDKRDLILKNGYSSKKLADVGDNFE